MLVLWIAETALIPPTCRLTRLDDGSGLFLLGGEGRPELPCRRSHGSCLVVGIHIWSTPQRDAPMRTSTRIVVIALTLFGLAAITSDASLAQTPSPGAAPSASDSLPAWAYPWDPDFQVPPADDEPHRLPRSAAAFSWKQARDLFFSPDWHPDDHPP